MLTPLAPWKQTSRPPARSPSFRTTAQRCCLRPGILHQCNCFNSSVCLQLDDLQLTVDEKAQNLRRLEAQRNELNAKGMHFVRITHRTTGLNSFAGKTTYAANQQGLPAAYSLMPSHSLRCLWLIHAFPPHDLLQRSAAPIHCRVEH